MSSAPIDAPRSGRTAARSGTERTRIRGTLADAGFVAPALEADALLEASAEGAGTIEELLERRILGEPLAWIVGSIRFCGIRIRVDPGVFVPRPQTEALARRAIELLPADGVAVDLCTGSGAVAAALAAARPGATVTATDLDPKAVAWAAPARRPPRPPGHPPPPPPPAPRGGGRGPGGPHAPGGPRSAPPPLAPRAGRRPDGGRAVRADRRAPTAAARCRRVRTAARPGRRPRRHDRARPSRRLGPPVAATGRDRPPGARRRSGGRGHRDVDRGGPHADRGAPRRGRT